MAVAASSFFLVLLRTGADRPRFDRSADHAPAIAQQDSDMSASIPEEIREAAF
jgi:hypothetical protein